MKKSIALLFVLVLGACKNEPKKELAGENAPVEKNQKTYPEALETVFDAHGGLTNWKAQRTLTYVLSKPNASETHTIDLWSRKDRVDTEKFAMGSSDGTKVWLLDTEGVYKGDAAFYHNLMFYFYAMPFVLADDGIHYGETGDLEYEGKNYPGIRISYGDGIGASPKDEYFIHFDPETHHMAWLGYTVTYRTGEVSDNVKWIRYSDWEAINGLKLPKSITWHKYEGRKILEPSGTMKFEDVTLGTAAKSDDFYAKPEQANWVASK